MVERTDYESDSYLGMLDELNDLNHEFNINEGFLWEEKITHTLKGLGFKRQRTWYESSNIFWWLENESRAGKNFS